MKKIPDVLEKIALKDLTRIDAALEGNWNPTVTTVWTKKDGFIGFSKVKKSHGTFKPSIELYFKDSWIGIHCFKQMNNTNVFDEKFAMGILDFIMKKLGMK